MTLPRRRGSRRLSVASADAIVLEWLTSPIRYCDSGDAAAEIAAFARDAANPAALAHHYDHQARRSFADVQDSQGGARLKTCCYAARAALGITVAERA